MSVIRKLFIVCLVVLMTSGMAYASEVRSQTDAQGRAEVTLPELASPADARPDVSMRNIPSGPSLLSPVHGTNVRAAGGPGTGTQAELSIAAVGPNIVISFNGGPNGGGYVTSTDGGATFGPMTSPPRPPGSSPCCDTGVASDFLGRFYYLELYRNDGANNCTNSVHVSTNGGQTFGGIVGSPFTYAPGTDFADQPHIGIDRINLVGGNPQLYVTTRHFTAGINCPQTGTVGTVQGEVTCSVNGGAAWAAPTVLAPFTDFGRTASGADGSVYLVGVGAGGTILLRRSLTDCAGGLAFGAPLVVASGLTYGTLAIDRETPQPHIAVDQLNPNVVYVGWSSDRLPGDNDRDIFLTRCVFTGTAGAAGPRIRVNDDAIGSGNDQYFPMLAIDPSNRIIMSWNDERAGANSNAIYHAEVGTNGPVLSVGDNYLVSDINFTPANFPGMPDYGDYNENNMAIDGQHFYTAWVSHVSAPGITPASNDPDIFFAVVNNLQNIRVSGDLDFGNLCVGVAAERTLSIFNTGDATLTVNSVTNVLGSPAITVDPNPATPVLIGPNSHVDFIIRVNATAPGLSGAIIRVSSDDPDQPTLDLTYQFNALPGDIRVTGSTDLGEVCRGTFEEGIVSVCNVGQCDLSVTSAAFTPACADFSLINNPFPAVIPSGACVNLTFRFTPSDVGDFSCNLVITSNDPDQSSITRVVTANVPEPFCVIDGENVAYDPEEDEYTAIEGTVARLCGPDGDYRYQWTLPGEGEIATTQCIELDPVEDDHAGDYTLVVTDECGVQAACEVDLEVEDFDDAATTLAGNNVQVSLTPATVTFNQVSQPGSTYLKYQTLPDLPAGYRYVVPQQLDIKTTAAYTGLVGVKIQYPENMQHLAHSMRVLRYNAVLASWTDITKGVDVNARLVLADCTYLAAFALVIPEAALLPVEPMEEKVAFGLGQSFPNPSRGATTFRFGVTQSGPVRLTVHDLQGRLVATLVSEERGPGNYTAVWNARDVNRRKLSAGLYVVRLDTPEGRQSRKLVLAD